MIKIEFEQKSKKEIVIFSIDEGGNRKEIGHIFTPAGSGETFVNAIQVCGFDESYDLWGCGVYGDKATGKMKKDIQLLWFNDYDKMNENEKRTVVIKGQTDYLTDGLAKELGVKGLQEGIKKDRFSIDGICHRCYNHPCSCEVKITYENPYTVKRQQDLKPNTKKEYEQAVKNAVLRALEDKK